ncbi:hypothetical protein LXL04_001516 [Taraxacum kok-saghyz]
MRRVILHLIVTLLIPKLKFEFQKEVFSSAADFRMHPGKSGFCGAISEDLVQLVNRDSSRILYVSGNALESCLLPENCVPIKPWKCEADDTALVDLIPFLEYVARNRPADIRPVLASYHGHDIAKEFIERSKEHQSVWMIQENAGAKEARWSVETPKNLSPNAEGKGSGTSPRSGRVYMSKAQDVVTSVLVKGESMDQRLQVSGKTMPAIIIDEKKLNNTGSTIKSSRYVTAGTTWLKGAFGKVAKAGQVIGLKTRQK